MKQQMIPSGVSLYEMDQNRKMQTNYLRSEAAVDSQRQECESEALESQEANPWAPVCKEVGAEAVFEIRGEVGFEENFSKSFWKAVLEAENGILILIGLDDWDAWKPV
jgi:hypothetical protein